MARLQPDVVPGRLNAADIERNFADLHPPLTRSEALIAADRCYFCYAAPCTTACPTGIDIPRFIQSIRSGDLEGAAHTILSENIMGGMCARVCPTEVLCEQACVRNVHEEKPVDIGLLQRYATDPVFASGTQLFGRAESSGKRVAVIGGGPAALSCAHRLACLGHEITIMSRDGKLGGLNEFGIAAYKTVDDFAQREVAYILSIGGIEVRTGVALGRELSLAQLCRAYDAVFLAVGLAGVNQLGLESEDLPGVIDAVKYIAELRQAADKTQLPVGRRVVVIGGGMTAIDVAVQSKHLGAEDVTIVYRRGQEQMGASRFEQDLARRSGVRIKHWARPVRLVGKEHVTRVELEYTREGADGKLEGTGETFALNADIVFKAIGQEVAWDELGAASGILRVNGGRIAVDSNRKTTLDNVWAGGDCVTGGQDLTVTAVQDGKLAAQAIDAYLRSDG
ncbi:MAG: FAD-dependent pyridine nucleotide-disulfide oxidoreductase [Steroidobacteraceae bacterium]|nr:FAD-dependent pyridine nucleotide-disulfide oxidoreductase [Steroidobacteraceae bacterium]